MDDLWRSRLRADAYLMPDPGHSRSGVPAFLGKVTSTGTNLGVGKFCQVLPVSVTGTESDGSASAATAGPASVIALAIGPTAPATNDLVVVRRVDHRWVFDKQTIGGGGTPTPGFTACCPSNALPTTVSISFAYRSGTSSANYGHQTVNTTLTFSATAPAYAPSSQTNKFFSPTFVDDLGQTDYYMLSCNSSGQIALSFGTVGFGVPIACIALAVTACSPFLVTGQPLGSSGAVGGTHGSCFQGTTGGGSTIIYGTDPADIITIS